ncbi:hypothetical protein JW964_13100 [candidate division KSB1 bacterium]|nr:hypothetical protein [candidate division KSB1 bacterium]
MAKIISIHEYPLRPNVTPTEFEQAVQKAIQMKLFDLPGLKNYYFLRGVKGKRRHKYTAIWIYESQAAWEKLWSTPEKPLDKNEYPEPWKIWENEILVPLLDQEPENIDYTSYEIFEASTSSKDKK